MTAARLLKSLQRLLEGSLKDIPMLDLLAQEDQERFEA